MTQTIIDQFMSDLRVTQAKNLLLDALCQHQGGFTGARPAEPALVDSYRQQLEAFAEVRGGNLYYPYLGSGIGRGCLVELADGSIKYDMIGGIGAHYFGHSDPEIIAASIDAAIRDTIMQGNLQQNVESLRFSKTLLDLARRGGSSMAHCFLTTSGAMANENALKLIFQKRQPADRLLAFEHCFAGRTIALAAVTDKPAYREGLPVALQVDYLPFFNADDAEGSTKRALAALDQHLADHPGKYAGMVLELVQGEGGYYGGQAAFFRALMTKLRENNIAVMADEIQTFGRTTQPFAFQHYGLDDLVDVVTVGKLTQVCATLFTDNYKPAPGLISQTFTAGSVQLAAAQCILDRMIESDLFGKEGRIVRLSEHLRHHLRALAEKLPGCVAGPYGEGAMIAFTPFDGSPEHARKLLNDLFEAGVIAFVTGSNPSRVRMLPPMGVVTTGDIDAVCAILENVLTNTQGK